jgi:SAM-dependent methyltransferase
VLDCAVMKARQLASAVCPGIIHAQVRYKDLLRQLLQPETHWLDLGCGHEVIRPWALLPGEEELSFTRVPALSVGVDRDVRALRGNRCIPHRVAGDILALPFAENSFELVTANMVLEHAEKPAAVLSEVWRVLRPEGTFVFHTPNRYHPGSVIASLLPDKIKSRLVTLISDRREKDVYPTFYRINTQSAIRHYSEAAGFRIQSLDMVETLGFNRHRVIFLSCLALARLLRWKALGRFRPDILVMLRKPAVECACKRLPRCA